MDEDMMVLRTLFDINTDRYQHDHNDLHVSTCQACKDIKSVDMIQYE